MASVYQQERPQVILQGTALLVFGGLCTQAVVNFLRKGPNDRKQAAGRISVSGRTQAELKRS